MFATADVLGIFIITPTVSQEIPLLRYDRQVQQIEQQIGGLIPGVDATIVQYTPLEDGDPAKQPKDGKFSSSMILGNPSTPRPRGNLLSGYMSRTPQPDRRRDTLTAASRCAKGYRRYP
jgi:hypothetical protein